MIVRFLNDQTKQVILRHHLRMLRPSTLTQLFSLLFHFSGPVWQKGIEYCTFIIPKTAHGMLTFDKTEGLFIP